jgi:hypothetical protein
MEFTKAIEAFLSKNEIKWKLFYYPNRP